MPGERRRIEEYRRSGYYYIPARVDDLLWSDQIGEWKMTSSANNMRSCLELDRVARELDELGYEIILKEFRIEPDKYNLEQIRYMNPLELEKSIFII